MEEVARETETWKGGGGGGGLATDIFITDNHHRHYHAHISDKTSPSYWEYFNELFAHTRSQHHIARWNGRH